jgi:AsmA protein
MKIRLLLKIIGGILALVIIAALVVPMFISADFIKAQLTEQVKKSTGRDLAIKGKASLSLFPNIAVTVEDVTLGNPAGFTTPYFVHIDRLQTGAALMPLLSKELRITGLTLGGAKLNLEETKSGAKNWDFAGAKAQAAPAEPAPAGKEKPSPLKQLAIGTVHIKDAALNYSKAGAAPVIVDAVQLSIKGADGASPLKVDGSARYQGEVVQLQLDVKNAKEFLSGKFAEFAVSLGLPATKLAFSGKVVPAALPDFMGKGTLTFASDDLPKLVGWATGKKPSGSMPKKVDISVAVTAVEPKNLMLKDLKATVDGTQVKGALEANLAGAAPALKGTLDIDKLDLDAWTGDTAAGAPAAPAANATKPAATAASSSGWSDAPIDASGLRAVNADMKLTIGMFKTGKIIAEKIVADAVLNDGVLKLNLTGMNFYGGTAKGSVTLDGSAAGIGLTTTMEMAGIMIEPLMVDITGASRLVGNTSLNLAVAGRGASQRALVGSLNGHAAMRVNDGAVKGVNIASFLRDAKQGFLLPERTMEKTDFTELTATYKITQGVVSNDDLAMKSPVLRLAGKGTVSLPARSINYRLVPTIVGTLKGQGGKDGIGGLEIPLLVTGPWSAISVTPDVAGLVEGAIKNPEALKQNIKDIKSTIGDFNSPKDIGKALFGGGKKEAAPVAAPTAQPATAPAPATEPAAAPAPQTKEQKLQEDIGGLIKALGK